jgi:hypothetical protein
MMPLHYNYHDAVIDSIAINETKVILKINI